MKNHQYDSVVVGAGPYGLSCAAHLRARGLQVAVFGKPMGLWRNHMPHGMLLRSHWWATDLSDPRRQYSFSRFFGASEHEPGYPVPIQTFIEYGLWFQERAVPDVDATFVRTIEREGRDFRVHLVDGRELVSRTVVMAVGPYYFAHRPPEFGDLSADRVSHSADHSDYGRFTGLTVVVVGGGQSAIEYAALLRESGATVHVVSRRRLLWLGPDRDGQRSLAERMRRPKATIAPGWENWVLDHAPYLFYRFSQPWKDAYNSNYHSGASDWLRDRILGKVELHEESQVASATVVDGRLRIRLSDGSGIVADHIMLATGFHVELERLSMLAPGLRGEIRTDRSIPLLNNRFEASVPGLYFVGLASLRAFGPLYRFVAGCGAAARRVAGAAARR